VKRVNSSRGSAIRANQSAELFIANDFANWLSRFKRWIKHDIADSLMGPLVVVMLHIRINRSPQMLLTDGNDPIETLMLD